jgi:predicted membrane-bound mannosyltransferase
MHIKPIRPSSYFSTSRFKIQKIYNSSAHCINVGFLIDNDYFSTEHEQTGLFLHRTWTDWLIHPWNMNRLAYSPIEHEQTGLLIHGTWTDWLIHPWNMNRLAYSSIEHEQTGLFIHGTWTDWLIHPWNMNRLSFNLVTQKRLLHSSTFYLNALLIFKNYRFRNRGLLNNTKKVSSKQHQDRKPQIDMTFSLLYLWRMFSFIRHAMYSATHVDSRVSQPLSDEGTHKTFSLIARNSYLRKCLRGQKKLIGEAQLYSF